MDRLARLRLLLSVCLLAAVSLTSPRSVEGTCPNRYCKLLPDGYEHCVYKQYQQCSDGMGYEGTWYCSDSYCNDPPPPPGG